MNSLPNVLIDGSKNATISPQDRGLLYGDGLFETVLMINGIAPLWKWHVERLRLGCQRLKLPTPDIHGLEKEIAFVCESLARAVVRITLTRGVSERGYALPHETHPTRLVSSQIAPVWPAEWYRDGIRVRWCQTRLGLNLALAGIKHLNRLEQVLARAEWDDPNIPEGLMCDSLGQVISATAMNLFFVRDGRLFTPKLDQSGVAGVARAAVMEELPQCEASRFSPEELLQSDEIFLTNSIRGIVPVRQIDEQIFPIGNVTRHLQNVWRTRTLMLAE